MSWIISQALMGLYESSHCSPEQGAAFWAGSSSGGARSAPSSGSPTPQAYSYSVKTTDSSPRFPSGMTSKPLTADRGADLLTWYLEGFLARTSPQLEREPALQALGRDYGVRWRELSTRYSPDTCLWKIPPSLWDEGWKSSLETLPRWGSMLDGELWERVTLARRTSETASGFLPTPVKYDTHGTWESNNYHGLGWSAKHAPESLDNRGANRRAKQWPTPVKNENRAAAYTPETSFRHFDEGSHQVHLAQAVRDPRMFPTPTASAGGHREPPASVRWTASGRMESSTGTFRQVDIGQAAKVMDRARGPGPKGTWPTPTCTQPKMPTETLRARMQDGKHEGHTSVPLVEVLQRITIAEHDRKMYPTPIRSDGKVSKNEVTLQKVENGEAFNQLSRAIRMDQMKEAGEWVSNPDAVRGESELTVGRKRQQLPTPTRMNGLRGGAQSEHRPMKWQSPGHPEYGELNADWVEWIMGWPIGWTDLEPMNLEAFEQWWEMVNAGTWWFTDPSDIPVIPDDVLELLENTGRELQDLEQEDWDSFPRLIPKTIKPADEAAEARRVDRIAALGNGQVSAVAATATTQMSHWAMPEGEDDGDDA